MRALFYHGTCRIRRVRHPANATMRSSVGHNKVEVVRNLVHMGIYRHLVVSPCTLTHRDRLSSSRRVLLAHFSFTLSNVYHCHGYQTPGMLLNESGCIAANL